MVHDLEISWWPTLPVTISTIPDSSHCLLRNTREEDVISIQIKDVWSFFHSKWRPVFAIIDLCQLHALHSSEDCQPAAKDMYCRLILWYDRLRFHVICEAKGVEFSKIGDWIPDVMHRFLARLESGKGHSPRTFAKDGDGLQQMYQKKPLWSYGKREMSQI